MVLDLMFSDFFRHGALGVIDAKGRYRIFGAEKPDVIIRLHDRMAEWELLGHPDLKLGELYMDGRLTLEAGDIADLLALLMRNLREIQPRGWHRLVRGIRKLKRRFDQFNPASRAKAHVAHHYDLSSALYDQFLGADRQYSCAYFTEPNQSLEAAQLAKKRHIAAKLCLNQPGLQVLDIGCGWGGLALDLACNAGAKVLGVTLSEEQVTMARDRAERAGVAETCRFELADYRALTGHYDRIVSVGMFEHVGAPYYDAFFAKARGLLKPDGVMLLHTIGRSDPPGSTNAWIAKYIFPGGYTPALSEIASAVERSGLIITDVEVLRLHYAETLRQWRERFSANREKVAALYDERFCRMWEFYLAGSEMAFRHDGEVVFQLQLARRQDAVPLTRDYMLDDERDSPLQGVEPVSLTVVR
ncbi:MAG TPA: class I SAM-dependent methyltransferase [Rhizomicrobium sp.]|nr:class I SAM-dependent methyltransferase [Rhizomicrobium sp.]